MRKLPALTREKAKTIFVVFKNPRHAQEFIPRVLDMSGFPYPNGPYKLKLMAFTLRRLEKMLSNFGLPFVAERVKKE
ncbi:MAG: hypothetical protein WC584_01135 [Candidatus Pacearchaeota archaeon]